MVKSREDFDVLEKEISEDDFGIEAILLLYNDDINSFDFVIESLIKVCNFNFLQAEQLTMLVHFRGKAKIKKGERKILDGLCAKLLDRGLTAEVR